MDKFIKLLDPVLDYIYTGRTHSGVIDEFSIILWDLKGKVMKIGRAHV